MKLSSRIISSLLVLNLLVSAPAYAASGGRISSGGFRSSSSSFSSGRSSSRSSSRPSYSYRAPSMGSSYRAPSSEYRSRPLSPPVRRPTYSGGGPSVIVLPDLSPPPVVYVPTPVPSLQPPVSKSPEPSQSVISSKDSSKVEKTGTNFGLNLLLLLGILLLVALIVMSRQNSMQLPGRSYGESAPGGLGSLKLASRTNLAQVKVALLASAKDLKEDLERLANEGDTDSEEGLAAILQETSLAILRHPDKAIFAYSEIYKGSESEVESIYNRVSMEERSKISEELLSNVSGSRKGKSSTSDDPGEYLLVSLIVATSSNLNLKPSDSASSLSANLVELGSISPDNLLGLEIIWQPEGDKEVLTQDELLALYPELNRL